MLRGRARRLGGSRFARDGTAGLTVERPPPKVHEATSTSECPFPNRSRQATGRAASLRGGGPDDYCPNEIARPRMFSPFPITPRLRRALFATSKSELAAPLFGATAIRICVVLMSNDRTSPTSAPNVANVFRIPAFRGDRKSTRLNSSH